MSGSTFLEDPGLLEGGKPRYLGCRDRLRELLEKCGYVGKNLDLTVAELTGRTRSMCRKYVSGTERMPWDVAITFVQALREKLPPNWRAENIELICAWLYEGEKAIGKSAPGITQVALSARDFINVWRKLEPIARKRDIDVDAITPSQVEEIFYKLQVASERFANPLDDETEIAICLTLVCVDQEA